MFCPYCQKSYIKAVNVILNEDNIEQGHILSEYYGYYECQKEKCGAYYMGRCTYNEQKS